MEPYSKTFDIRWADLDPNLHMRHTAYNDYAAHVRLCFLSDKGFDLKKFNQLGMGPVLFREETKYFKEVFSGDQLTVAVVVDSVSPDGRKWTIKHELTNSQGTKVAEITVDGAWLDLKTRKIVAPPPELMAAMGPSES